MNFDWKEYLDLAQELAGRGAMGSTEEARLRSAISRAYYASYGKARSQSSAPPNFVGSEHTFLWNQFKNSSNLTRKEIGTEGSRLRRDRNLADYEDVVTTLPSLAAKALVRSGKILNLLKKLP